MIKIFCIVLYKTDQPVLSASISGNWLFYSAYERNIRNHFPSVLESIKEQIGIHVLKWDGFYYALVFNDKIAVLALDQEISDHATYNLYQSIQRIENTASLQKIINQPEGAIESKIDKIQSQLDDAKNIALNSLDKIIERGEKIDTLLAKTGNLADNTIGFRKKTNHINRTCPGLFSIFSTLSSYMWRSPEYQYYEVFRKPR